MKRRRSLKTFPRGVSEIDRALDAVAKAELLRQPHRDVADGQDAAVAPDLVDDVAAVVRFDLLLHSRHHLRRAEVHLLRRAARCRWRSDSCSPADYRAKARASLVLEQRTGRLLECSLT